MLGPVAVWQLTLSRIITCAFFAFAVPLAFLLGARVIVSEHTLEL